MNDELENIKLLLTHLGFLPEEDSKGIYYKKYESHSNYIIKVKFDKEEIDYGSKIILGNKTTSNFEASENFVVLECINRLLEKGYSPENITLEKDYPLGHKNKGKLDILVTDIDEKSFLMIECKTWGNEYDKAIKKTLKDGGQLISYFQQDKSTKFLCLYTSKLENNSIAYKNAIIKIEADFNQATNTLEVFEKWNKNFKDNGIFEPWATPYNISIKALTKNSLIPLTKEDSSRIFNQFAEILRHNVVSDKPNAFNKLITLLLCKIVDEDRGENDELHFQWLENDTDISLQKRLNDLYKTGMQQYLTKVVTDYSDSDVEEIVGLNEEQKDIIKKMMTELRLKKNNEFAFKEVFNDASFEENSKVLKEVVELLQPYQVRYYKKQQFLGDFFELLLNTSIKQEAGQFFTPAPIARFIINSIPLRKIILDKITKGDTDFLPYVIDYAEGSGHFLTEVMDEIHNIILELNKKNDFKLSIKKKLNAWTDDYEWAYDFVYGIEKDYRLVKTSKVSCFLNGDGLARIFNADGLANFETDNDYKDRLKITSKTDSKDNQQFEVLIANPPYSVSSFKNTLINGDKSFELFNRLTDESSEIECLFIERTKQLLKDGGYAGIILPNSILNNSGIYSDAREILLKYFKIVAIVEFGSNTFMATGTNTVTLFLERRNNTDWQKIQYTVNSFFTNSIDVACNGIENPFSKFVAHVYKTISFEDYVSFIKQKPNENIKKHELFKDYQKSFENLTFVTNLKKKSAFKLKTEKEQETELDRLFYSSVLETEREKLLYFILAYPQKTLLIKSNPSGKNETEKEFLGYEFSNRRGHEGIKPYGAKSIQEATKLYDETNPLNPEKANYYIYNSFLGHEITVNEKLQNHIIKNHLVDMMDFSGVEFTKIISLAVKKKVEIESKWEIQKLENIIELVSGQSPLSEFYNSKGQGLPFYQGKIDFGGDFLNNPTTWTTKVTKKAIKNDILMSVRAPVGPVNINPFNEICIGRGLAALRPKDGRCLYQYLYQYLKNNQEYISKNNGLGFDSITREQILDFKIPLPPKNVQEQIVKEIEVIEKREKEGKDKIKQLKEQMQSIYEKEKQLYPLQKLSNFIEIISGGTPSTNEPNYWNGSIPWLSVVDFNNENRFVSTSEKSITEEGLKNSSTKYLNAGDIIISARGTVGAIAQLAIPMTFNQSCYGVRGKEQLNNGFLYYALKYEIQQFKNNASGAIFDAITTETFNSIFIPIPPISEQQRIISEIEKLESEISVVKKQLENSVLEKNAILKKYLYID